MTAVHQYLTCVHCGIQENGTEEYDTVDPMGRHVSDPYEFTKPEPDENVVVNISEHEEELHLDDVESVAETNTMSETEVNQD